MAVCDDVLVGVVVSDAVLLGVTVGDDVLVGVTVGDGTVDERATTSAPVSARL